MAGVTGEGGGGGGAPGGWSNRCKVMLVEQQVKVIGTDGAAGG